jgi:hypothetical protein
MRWLVPLAVAFVLASSASGGVTRAAAPCSTAQLVVWLDTQGDHAAGSTFYGLRFTNLGATCTLRGYPGVSAVNLTGGQLGKAASRDPSGTHRLVTLGRAVTAKAVVRITTVQNFPRSVCRPAAAAGLRVYPPNQTSWKVVPFPFSACTGSSVFLFVRSVEKV